MSGTYGFAGSEPSDFNLASGTISYTTTNIDTTYCRGGTSCSSSGSGAQTPAFVGGPFTGFCGIRFNWSANAGTGTGNILSVYNSSGTEVFRLASASGVLNSTYWNGSALTSVGSGFSYSTGTRYTLNVNLDITNGVITFYVNGSQVYSASVSLASFTNCDHLIVRGNNSSCTVSEMVVADENLVGWHYYQKPPTGNGTNTAWANDYTALDEGATDDSDYIESTSAGDKESMTHGSVTVTGTVKAVIINGRVKNSAGGPQNCKGLLRIGSTDYTSGNMAGVGGGFSPAMAVFTNDPSTSSPWSNSAAQDTAMEFGFQSAA